jgi:hypothetical protein
LTAVVLACAYRDHGLRRGTGVAILLAYGAFAVTLTVLAAEHAMDLRLALGTAGLVAVVAAAALLRRRSPGGAASRRAEHEVAAPDGVLPSASASHGGPESRASNARGV